jgi:hypothetical protein
MRMPQFSAEASLYRTTGTYMTPAMRGAPGIVAIVPQQTFQSVDFILNLPVRLPPLMPVRNCSQERWWCRILREPLCHTECDGQRDLCEA